MFRRLSITIPQETYTMLQKETQKGRQSKFIEEAIREKIVSIRISKVQKKNPFEAVKEFRKKLKKKYTDKEIIDSIDYGREDGKEIHY